MSGDRDRNKNKFLARVSDIIHNSQYVHFGREAIGEKRDRAVRLPQSVFLDSSPGGGLCLMLDECIKYMREKGYSADGFEKTMFKDEAEVHFEHMRLFEAIHSRLVNEDLIVYPSIYFHPDLVKALTKGQFQRYQNIATSHGAVVALDEEDATHIVVADTEGMAVDPDGDFCRTLALWTSKKDSLAYVHWWFFPDSYDEWLRKDVIQGNEPEEASPESGKFRVCLRWLEDTQEFNEWMNEKVRFDQSIVPSSQFTVMEWLFSHACLRPPVVSLIRRFSRPFSSLAPSRALASEHRIFTKGRDKDPAPSRAAQEISPPVSCVIRY